MSYRIKNIVENFRTGEYSYNSALYMLEAFMQTSDAEELLRGAK